MRFWARFWVVPLSLFGLGMSGAMGPSGSAALAQQSSTTESTSWTSKMSSGVKNSLDKLGQAFHPDQKPSVIVPGPEDDAVSLKDKGKAGPGLNVAWARLSEQKGDLEEAEKQYQLALKLKRDYLPAILGYAQLKERLRHPEEAIELYQRAAKLFPQQASVHNNVGLCYARQGQLDLAVAALSRAIELDPKNPLYRNNIATVFVDKGMTREAFAQLRAVHGEAEANYNLGFLLNKKGQKEAALHHFTLAMQADPSMDAAKRWVDYLLKSAPQDRLASRSASNGVQVARRPEMPQPRDCPDFRASENGTVPFEARTVPKSIINETIPQQNASRPQGGVVPPPDPEESRPLRLPPIKSQRSEKEAPYLPGISYGPTPTAPMPPPTSNSALQPLPQVR